MDSVESSVSSGEKGSSAENKVFSAAKEEEAVEELVPPSPSSQDAILARHHWYLGGEVTTDAAVSVLSASDRPNCFGVYRKSDMEYVLSTKILVEDVGESICEHLPITTRPSGKFKVTGQAVSHEDIPEAVQQFISTFDPPLVPALQVTSFDTQFSIADDPPDYERANKVLKPDIAPLPDIAAIRVDNPEEAKTGHLTPATGSPDFLNRNSLYNYPAPQSTGRIPYGTALSQWRRHPDKHRCHPKNTCTGCCYRKRTWNGYRYETKYHWYDCRGSGPLRLLALLIFFLLCGPCFGCGICCYYCFVCIIHICFGDYDS